VAGGAGQGFLLRLVVHVGHAGPGQVMADGGVHCGLFSV